MIKRISLVSLFFLLAQLQIVFAAAPAEISFYETVQIDSSDILLGDIADVQCGDEARRASLRSLKLGNAAAPGAKIVFSERLLHLRLISAGGNYDSVAWHIPASITVETRSQVVAGAELARRAKEFVLQQLQINGELRTYTVESINTPNDLLVPVGEIDYEFKLPYGIKYAFPSNVAAAVHVNGQLYKKSVLRVKVHVYEPIVIANRSLSIGQAIGVGDVRLENMDVSGLAPGYFNNVSEVTGMVVKRALNSGMPLNDAFVSKPVIMKRQAMIRIVSTVGGIQVETDGQALQDGRDGDWIRVKNTRSNKILSGKVLDSTTVDVSAQ